MISEWIICPICGNKTRDRVREDTVLNNYPLHILFAVLLICGAVGFWIFSYNAAVSYTHLEFIRVSEQ